MIQKLLLIFLLITLTIIACKENPSEKKLNETVEYYPNNSKVIFKKTIHQADFDSVFYFYDNGLLFKKGKQYKDNQKFGNWELYDKNSRLREIREWFVIDGKSQINRAWFLNKKGDTIAWRKENNIFAQKNFKNDTLDFRNTNYNTFNFITSDTIKNSEFYFAFANCGSPEFRDYNSKVKIVVDNTNSLKKDFSNATNIKLDTFYYAKIDTIHKAQFPRYDLEKVVAFSGKFKKTGKKTIRGYLVEYTNQYPIENNKKTKAESKTYFEKTIYVKDSLD
jgi:hypothetical protein